MQKKRFEYLCAEAEAGRDAFVRRSLGTEAGLVMSCSLQRNHMVVRTNDGQTRCLNYHECEDLRHRKSGPMI